MDQTQIGDAASIVVIAELPLWTQNYLHVLNIKSAMKVNIQIINPTSI